jgi:hemerythrin-like domain-containing protein
VETIRILQDEHRSLAAVLHGMRYLVREVRERGAKPPFDVLGAMIYYIDAFPERVHHPRESAYLFRHLRERCGEAVPLIDALEAEHREGAERIRALEQALTRYQQGGADEFAAFAAAVESYADFQLEHIGREERELLPLARKHLRDSDWAIIDAAFEGGKLPAPAEGPPEAYEQLFDRIVRLAPPPIGVGADLARGAR